MNKLLVVAAALVLAAAVAPLPAQDSSRLYSVPPALPQDALDRLRLKTAWSVTVPTDGRRDGLFTVQVAPRGPEYELLVQTRSGAVLSLDATTGRVRWSTRVGSAYRPSQPVAYNRNSVFVINNITVFALNRDTGGLQWQYEMPAAAVAPPAADDEQLYLSLSSGRFLAYTLPNLATWEKLVRQGKVPGATTALEAARVRRGIDLPAIGPLSGIREAYRLPPEGPQPTERYNYATDDRVEGAPLVAQDRILLPEVGGRLSGLARGAGRLAWPPVHTHGQLVAPAGQHDETAYIASNDFSVYALSMSNGRVFWRTAVGGIPSSRPVALDEDVYVPVDRSRLVRLRRVDGDETWRNEDAARFLAAGRNFVYAADPQGRLVVIDRARGTTLSTYDGTRDFVFPVQNEWTDRVYLAAHNGLIVCLHDRDSDRPLVVKNVKGRAPLPPPAKAAEKPAPKDMGEGEKPAPKDAGEGAKPKDMGEGAKPVPPGDAVKP